jgi:hypothetical protein
MISEAEPEPMSKRVLKMAKKSGIASLFVEIGSLIGLFGRFFE